MKIWLVGMMGSGKSTVGRMAARSLEVSFIDTDHLVEQKVGMTIADFWAGQGEPAFRNVERAVIAEIEPKEAIVATGGGVVLDESNRSILTRSGTVVWLYASAPVIADRVPASTKRPLLDVPPAGVEAVVFETISARAPMYDQVADHRIDTDDLDVESVARRVEALWKF